MNSDLGIANKFYSQYYAKLLKDLLNVLLDGFHKQGFNEQVRILRILIEVVNSEKLTIPFEGNMDKSITNKQYVANSLLGFLLNCKTIAQSITKTFVQQLFVTCGDQEKFTVITLFFLSHRKDCGQRLLDPNEAVLFR